MKLKLEARQKRQDGQEDSTDVGSETDKSSTVVSISKVSNRANPSFLSFSKRKFSRFFACVAILSLWLFIGIKGWAAYGEYAKQHESEELKPVSKIAALQSGYPRLTISDSAGEKVVDIAPQAVVVLNNVPATIKDLRKGDAVSVELNAEKEITKITARRTAGGYVLAFDPNSITITSDYTDRSRTALTPDTKIVAGGKRIALTDITRGDCIEILADKEGRAVEVIRFEHSIIAECFDNFRKNLFKPLLLFFYMGFAIPLLRIAFDFPQTIYQGLTIYLLVSIGWHGGEELATLSGGTLKQAFVFMGIGFVTNFCLGIVAFAILRTFVKRMRQIDAATVAAYYGSDSAGTFVTCMGVLQAANIAFAAYMPVLLAIMEIPGCLVGLYLVSKLRKRGMDVKGNMPMETGYAGPANLASVEEEAAAHEIAGEGNFEMLETKFGDPHVAAAARSVVKNDKPNRDASTAELMREVFLNPGLFLLFGGIVIGFISRLQGNSVTAQDDQFFVVLFHGILCLFLLEMGMTAAKRLKDLKQCGAGLIAFGLIIPNIFATTGILIAHAFSFAVHTPFQLGTYALFAVLCGSSSYIAVPAIQRIAIPEASPTLPLAASLGLTFSYNVSLGIPIYLAVAEHILRTYPVV